MSKPNSLAEFIRHAWRSKEPLKWAWHLDAICDHLEALAAGKLPRLLVNTPPSWPPRPSLIVRMFIELRPGEPAPWCHPDFAPPDGHRWETDAELRARILRKLEGDELKELGDET